jgi:CheY-like chemotaxis protein/cell division septation protein DedD
MTGMNRKKRILVIDDDKSAGLMIAEALGPKGFEVLSYADPFEGAERAKEIKPDLVFMSLIFPDSNGLKMSKMLHSDERLKAVPIIMLISYRGELDPKYTTTIGIVDVLVKPLSAGDIVSKARKILGSGMVSAEVEEPVSVTPAGEEVDISALDKEWFADLEQTGPKAGEGEPFKTDIPVSETNERDMPGTEKVADLDLEKEGPESSEDRVENYVDYELEDEVIKNKSDIHESDKSGRDDEDLSYDESEPSKSPLKKIFVIVGSLIVIAGVGIAALQVVKNYFNSAASKKISSPPVKAAPVGKELLPEARKEEPKPEEAVPRESMPPSAKGGTAPAQPAVQKEAKASAKEKESQVPAETGEFAYSVQIGAFSNAKNAAVLVDKMKEKGYDAFIREEAGGKRSRVLIGRFDSKNKALEEARLILQKEGIKTIVYHR